MVYNEEVCELKHKLINQRVDGIEEQVLAFGGQLTKLDEKIDSVIKLQTVQTYSIIGVLVTAVLILVGVLLGRGFDFGLIHV